MGSSRLTCSRLYCRFFKTPDGVKIQELAIGKGSQVAKPGDQLVLDYVLRCFVMFASRWSTNKR